MKKVLSIILVLMMVLSAVACSTSAAAPAESAPAAEAPKAEAPKAEEPKAEEPKAEEPAPAAVSEPEPAPAAEVKNVALGLNIKNKTGVTINELYIYPAGQDKGNSVVAAGWQDKDVDPEGYEKNIYIVRPEGAEMEVYVVFEDGSNATWQVGPLAMYDKLSMKKGTDVSQWEHEANDDEADKALMDTVVATGKTADHTYPGYVEVAAEVKNKTGKNIVEFYLYEEGGDPKAYNNMVEYMYDAEGNQFTSWTPGKAKEGGKYIFSYFLRPQADTYVIDLVYDDGTTLTAPIEDWWTPDGGGNKNNEISMKDAADPDLWKIAFDDGTDDDYGMLMDERLAYEINTVGVPADGWYPKYEGAPEATDASKAALIELVKAAVPFANTGDAAPAEEPAAEAPAAEAPADGAIGLNVKNKTGVAINEFYIYPVGEDKGENLLPNGLPTQDKEKDTDEHEAIVVVTADPAKLAAMEVYVVFAEGDPVTWTLANPLKNYDEFSLKKGTDPAAWEHQEADVEDHEAIDAAIQAAAGAEPQADGTIGLNVKNKTGVAISEFYIYPVGEDKGENLLPNGLPTQDKEKDTDEHEAIVVVKADPAKLAAMEVYVVFAEGDPVTWTLANPLKNYDEFSLKKGTDPAAWEHQEADVEDHAAIDAAIQAAK